MAINQQTAKSQDTHSYKGWLNSDSFLKRAFAIYGYMFVAGLIVAVPAYIFIFLVLVMAFMAMG